MPTVEKGVKVGEAVVRGSRKRIQKCMRRGPVGTVIDAWQPAPECAMSALRYCGC